MSYKRENIVAIDLLKTIAILMVVLVHIGQPLKGLPMLVSRAFEFGQMGVQVFFMISAYLLCKFDNCQEKPKNYFIKKFLRIAPCYYLAIVIYELLFIAISALKLPVRLATNTNLLDILSNVFFVNIFNPNGYNNVVPGGWSISCLVVFYVLYPLLFKKWREYSFKKATVLGGVYAF